jgi:hypothetical protein
MRNNSLPRRKSLYLLAASCLMALFLALLISLLPSPATAFDPTVSCSPCKSYNQWTGGTSGAYERLDPHPMPDCSQGGCEWVQKGMWTKYNATGNYIFLGTRRVYSPWGIFDPSHYRYMYTVFKPSGGTYDTYIDIVNTNPNDSNAGLYVYSSGGSQRVALYSTYVSYGPVSTTITESLWDVLQTGTRLHGSTYAVGYNPYTTRYHQWRCQSCGDIWVYQSSNGTFLTQGNPTAMGQLWQVQPSQPNSQGGVYYAYCYTGQCP